MSEVSLGYKPNVDLDTIELAIADAVYGFHSRPDLDTGRPVDGKPVSTECKQRVSEDLRASLQGPSLADCHPGGHGFSTKKVFHRLGHLPSCRQNHRHYRRHQKTQRQNHYLIR